MKKLIVAAVALFSVPALAKGGKHVSLKGEIIDTVCFLSKGAHGPAHKACAQGCLKAGNPAALLSGGKLYALLAAHGNESAMDAVKAHAGDVVTITGDEIDKDGLRAVFVTAVQ